MNKLYFATQCKDKDILSKSSSGGMFSILSNYIFNNNGIVYGASFTKDFRSVDIIRVDSIDNLNSLLTSKYMMSNVRDSFSLVKKDLEDNKLVLYSGLPCQIHGLRNFLKRDYENLICVDIVCHGTLPGNIWKDYLDVLSNKTIVDVNMRDKRLGWYDYGMSIKYEDGSEFFENHKSNQYMKAFLSDKYLNKSCYDCKCKNENCVSDITIGDYWGLVTSKISLDKKVGTNLVIVNSEKGKKVFNEVSKFIDSYPITKEMASTYNAGLSNKITTRPSTYDKNIFSKNNRVAILTLNFNNNIGGVLQAYALQTFLKNNYYDSTIIQSHDYWDKLSFVSNLKRRSVSNMYSLKDDFDTYIVGSDQVWRREYICGKWKESWKSHEPLFLKFTKDWNVRRIAYSASYGKSDFDFKDNRDVKECLDRFDAISMRELDSTSYISSITNTSTINTCDPTMLLDKEEYLKLCENIATKENGLFTYILDTSDEKSRIANKILTTTSKVDRVVNNVEDWLACYRDCKCVLTDSYHGVVFSIIFNKPFICVINKGRGGSRFETLKKLFNIENRFVEREEEIDYNLLKESPNVDYAKLVEVSKNYLLTNLEKKIEMKKVKRNKTSPVFGIISWFPNDEPARTQRINRLNKMFEQIRDLFGDVNYLIVAQNWKDYKLPDFVNATIFKYNKLGILGARKTLGKHFLESKYDYLIMLDDDIILETSNDFSKEYFFEELNKHPQGFAFLKYGWSLTFCAISKYIYSQSPMCDIDPEKGEGYEDVVWPNLLHYKYPNNEFKLNGIKFVQNQQQYVKELKSTWCNRNTNHGKLEAMSKYYVNQFKKGNFSINKQEAIAFMKQQEWFEKAIWYGWVKKEEYEEFKKKYGL